MSHHRNYQYDQTLIRSQPVYRIDNYDDGTQTVTQIGSNYQNYMHCNWGWDGVFNGFFAPSNLDSHTLSANFRPDAVRKRDNDYNYQYFLDLQIGIHP